MQVTIAVQLDLRAPGLTRKRKVRS